MPRTRKQRAAGAAAPRGVDEPASAASASASASAARGAKIEVAEEASPEDAGAPPDAEADLVQSDSDSDSDSDDDEEDDDKAERTLDGVTYATYQEMVNAKRARNRDFLGKTGLLDASASIRESIRDEVESRRAKRREATRRGIRSKRTREGAGSSEPLPKRKSSRLAGVKAEGFYVEDERAGRITVRRGISGAHAGGAEGGELLAGVRVEEDKAEKFFNDRINDGSDLSVAEAVELTGSKWASESSVPAAERFLGGTLPSVVEEWKTSTSVASTPTSSPKSVSSRRFALKGGAKSAASIEDMVASLSVDSDECVAKVTPDRIYAVAAHPSASALIVCAGDKQGHVGIWNVDRGEETGGDEGDDAAASDGVHLFKVHNRPVTHLEWDSSGRRLYSASYDGSVRSFDVETQTFEEIFATYDDSKEYNKKLGFKLDTGYGYWPQYACLDPRFDGDDKCLFMATSRGTVIHADLRLRERITFHERLSEKKINTVSLHPNGYTLATAGLDTTVKLWDVRSFRHSKKKDAGIPSEAAKPLATQTAGKSINSAFFSPSGSTLLTTTMANTLDLTSDFHLQSGRVKPTTRIRHDNHTGRWLSTFMARWHPAGALPCTGGKGNAEVFVVGSMRQPRTIEIFEGSKGTRVGEIRGDALTAVASRCCFHPRGDRLVVMGGNSSGRVTIAR